MSNTNYYGEIGSKLKELRLIKNLSRKQLADGICSVSYIARIENGNRCPTSVILRQLAIKLGTTTEELFRVIESPHSLKVKDLTEQLFRNVERNDYKGMAQIIDSYEENLQINSIHDLQIINAFKTFSYSMMHKKYAQGAEQLREILDLTYSTGTSPTDIEFAIMTTIAYLLLLNRQSAKAYEYLTTLDRYVDSIRFIHTNTALPRYYLYLTMASMDFMPLEDSFKQIERAIEYSKRNNAHPILRELYVLKGELFLKEGDEENYKVWLDKALTLHELIKVSDDDYFLTFVENRKKLTHSQG